MEHSYQKQDARCKFGKDDTLKIKIDLSSNQKVQCCIHK